MIGTGFHVFVYAVAAAASPLVLTATFVVIRSDRPRTNGIAFLTGFLAGTAFGCVVGLIVGDLFVMRLDSHRRLSELVTLLLGAALISFGLHARRAPPHEPEAEGGRAGAVLERLAHVGPATALAMAGLLGFGGPKRLVLTFLAMTTITQANLSDAEDLTLVLVYIGVATVVVTVPVGIVIVAGERAAELLARGQSWLTEHATVLRVWLALGLGLALVADALLRLFD